MSQPSESKAPSLQSSVLSAARTFWRVAKGTADGLAENEAGIRAAALAYQGLFSLFPLLFFLIFIGSQVITSVEVRAQLDAFLENAIPTRGVLEFIRGIIQQTVDYRGSIGLIGLLGLLWTSSTLFSNLEASLNAVWKAPRRSVAKRRLLAILAVLILGTLFLIAIVLSALPALPFLNRNNPIWDVLDLGLGLVVEILLFWLVYRILPNTSVKSPAALGGAVLAGLLWEGAQAAFRWYLTSGLDTYGAVYGTLASAIALILWAYFTGIILFLGAEFTAALQREFWPDE